MKNQILVYNDYVYCKVIDLDMIEVHQSCKTLNTNLTKKFQVERLNGQKTLELGLFKQYNVLSFPNKIFHDLLIEISKLFKECALDEERYNDKYYIQCWLNNFYEGEFIDWHTHQPSESNSWHGFYCVHTESSFTSYKYQDEIFHVPSQDNMLIISRSAGDLHRSSPWNDKHQPRVTIAFDIVKRSHLISRKISLNHWIPLI